MHRVTCKFCGAKGWKGTNMCDSCWEVDRRLEYFAKTPAGRARLLDAVDDALLGWRAEHEKGKRDG